MSTTSPYIGRREAIGLGIETVPGTSVPPQIWLRWLTQGIQDKTTPLENESAMGVVDRVNDSEVAATWAEGSIGGKVTSESIGFLLLGLFGSVSTGVAVSGIYPHTFSVNQSSIPSTQTITRNSPLGAKRHSYGTFDNLNITAQAGGWVEMSTAVKARAGADSSETVAFTTEKEFTSKNIALRVAADIASLSGATDIAAKSLKLTMQRSSEKFDPLGTGDVPQFDRGTFEASGEFVVRLTDSQYHDDFIANTVKALRITLSNGTTNLQFTAGRVRYRSLDESRDRDAIVTATIAFFCEFNTSQNASIVPVLNVSRATYVAA